MQVTFIEAITANAYFVLDRSMAVYTIKFKTRKPDRHQPTRSRSRKHLQPRRQTPSPSLTSPPSAWVRANVSSALGMNSIHIAKGF